MAAQAASHENSRSTIARPAWPNAVSFDGLSSAPLIAAASAEGSPGAYEPAVDAGPHLVAEDLPPSVATTARACAIASRVTSELPS